MLKASWHKHELLFKFDAKTSRGSMKTHTAYFIKLWESENPGIFGLGEASPLKGLSTDHRPDFEKYLTKFTENLHEWDENEFSQFPSIRFGLETAILDLKNGGTQKFFDTGFYFGKQSIPINGLVWMADKATMQNQIKEKIAAGFTTIKLKVGAIAFADELALLKYIRKEFTEKDITIRLDANGAFSVQEALEKLKRLSEFGVHSIEQPIKQGQIAQMAEICASSPLPIALDEELIGIYHHQDKNHLLETIKPPYIILKPTLLGGLKASKEWIEICNSMGIGWWMTSALESNIGLNAICQFTSTFQNALPQGLGTGSLYHNNIMSPLTVKNGFIFYNTNQKFKIDF